MKWYFTVLLITSILILKTQSVEAHDMSYDLSHLNDLQKEVTQHEGTEPAFNNAYWDHKEEGIYVDIVSGQALFSSKDKYDSGTGWPSFTRPIDADALTKHEDHRYGMSRVEVKSSKAASHLGHVFTDGPKEHGGKRYCMNSASLRFIPKDSLEKEGYGKYLTLFEPE